MDCISELGGVSTVARLVGCKPPSVMEWRKRGIPVDRCVTIERATQGRFACEQLRPDVRWVRVPDPDWPNLAGRPCIDVAPPPVASAANDATPSKEQQHAA